MKNLFPSHTDHMKKISIMAAAVLAAACITTGKMGIDKSVTTTAEASYSFCSHSEKSEKADKNGKADKKEEDGLKQITKPYLGVYRSEYIFFGKRDVSEEFRSVTVELTAKGQFILRYTTREGKSDEKISAYTYDEKTGEVALSSDFGIRDTKALKCNIKAKKGRMTVLVRYGNRTLLVKLVQE